MSTIPQAVLTVEVEDMSLDLLCFDYILSLTGDRRFSGKLTAYVTATLAANPGLARTGALIPRGASVNMPTFVAETESIQINRLWD